MKKLVLLLMVLLIAGFGLTAYAAYDIGSFGDTPLIKNESVTFPTKRQKRYDSQTFAGFEVTRYEYDKGTDISGIVPYFAAKVISATNGTVASDSATFVYGVDMPVKYRPMAYRSGYGLLNYYYKLNVQNTTFSPLSGQCKIILGGIWSPDGNF